MNQYVGKFQKNIFTKWLGFDKFEKLIYGVRYGSRDLREGTTKIIAQSILGGNPIVINNRLTYENRVIVDSALGAKHISSDFY